MAVGNDATVFEIRQTTAGNISSGNNRKGAVLRLKHEAQWENGYQSSNPNDDLGRVEFVTGDEWKAGNLSYHLKSRPKWEGPNNSTILNKSSQFICIDDVCLGRY